MDLSLFLNGLLSGSASPWLWVVLAFTVLYPAVRAKYPGLPDLSNLLTLFAGKILGKPATPTPSNPIIPLTPATPDDPKFPILSAVLKLFLASKGIPLASVVDAPSETLLSVKAEIDQAIEAKKAKHTAEVAALGK